MKPVILITIYRRYNELLKSLDNIESLKNEFSEKPDVVVVWACPVLGNLWFFEKLISEGKINHLVFRYRDNDDGPTSYPESLNLRIGLEFIQKNYQNIYVIGQATDVFPNVNTYKTVDSLMNKGEKAVLFFWANGIAKENVWHTSFFAISNDEKYWPPISDKNHSDTLEVQWGRLLSQNNLPFFKSHNSRSLKFREMNFDKVNLEMIPIKKSNFVTLNIVGYKSLWTKIKEFIKRIFVWR